MEDKKGLLAKILLSGALLCTCLTTFAYQVGFSNGSMQEKKLALKLNPPSNELEMACLALWWGEQNKKWSDR